MSQGVITSSNGWTASIEIIPVRVVAKSNGCPWYYSYEVEFDYNISFSGAPQSRSFDANVYLECTGGTGGEPYVYLGNFAENRMGTKATGNNARQYTASGGAHNYGDDPHCSEVDIYDVNCQVVRIDYWGNGVLNGSITFNAGAGALPIELFDFSAEVKDYGIELNWITLSELNNDFFLIEKSSNADDWFVVNTLEGAGTTASYSEYSMIDTELDGTTYYRLTQVDFDGKRTVYDPIVVTTKNNKKMAEAYPNPVGDKLYLPGLSDRDFLDVTSIYGEPFNESYYVRVGEMISVKNLPNGVYLFNVNREGSSFSHKVIVQH
ncbi:MAG: T9SS type A sorting domain-containing protein [Cryomorphaceae bacterium]